MSKSQLLEFEGRLQGMLAELAGSVERSQDLAAERASDPMDDLQRKEEIDFSARSLSTFWGRQRQIQLALGRLETGAYGVCEDCGDPISSKRLTAAPWAHLCVGCQEAAERELQAA